MVDDHFSSIRRKFMGHVNIDDQKKAKSVDYYRAWKSYGYLWICETFNANQETAAKVS